MTIRWKQGLVLKNATAWSTDDLRALVLACLRERGAYGPRHVTFAYQRAGTRRLGCADVPRGGSYMVKVGNRLVETTEGYRIRVNLPRPEKALAEVFHIADGAARLELKPDELRKVLITIEHEVDHTLGRRHSEMVEDSTRPCLWACGGATAPLGIRLAINTAPSKAEQRASKITEHEAAITKMQTRIKRLETAITSRRRRISALLTVDRREATAIAARRSEP